MPKKLMTLPPLRKKSYFAPFEDDEKSSIWYTKMAALTYWLVSLLKKGYYPSFTHALGLKFPPTMHVVLDNNYLQQFNEILIIGDIHGCYDELERFLLKANGFDPSILKIFVGDLVNKGPKNIEVLKMLRSMPSTLSVRGNHDELIIREYYNSQDPYYRLKDKNKWVKEMSFEDVEYLNKLPYSISLPSLNVVILHAGLIPGVPLHFNDPSDIVTIRNVVSGDNFSRGGLTGRSDHRDGEPWAELWPGPDHIYFGHDAIRRLQEHPYATGLDTGCVYGYWLTGKFIKGARTGMYLTVAAHEIYCHPRGKNH